MDTGKKIWAIAEGYIPEYSHGLTPEITSHETACILNTSDQEAIVKIMIYFADREPVGPYEIVVPARRTKHMRFNDLYDPQPIPRSTDYSSIFISSVPVVIQHTRLDPKLASNSLITTIAYAGNE